MKTKEQIVEAITIGKKSACIDGRDYSRLVDFFPVENWDKFGFGLVDGQEPPHPLELTEKVILRKLKSDVAFGFVKALDKRGISSCLMYEVTKMWLWILDDPLQHFDDYPMYGLPLFKAVAIKYGFNNPIGSDSGSENEYNDE